MKEFADRISSLGDGKTYIYSLGQAGFIVKSKSGQLLAIDPYLSDCVEKVETDHIGYKRLLPKVLNADEIELDVLICTHFHRDHYDMDAVPKLMSNGRTNLYCPKDCECDVKKDDVVNYTFVKPGTSFSDGDFRIHFINCDHGINAPFAVGVIVEVDGYKILETGDTCLRIDRKDEYLSFGKLDIMIAPINGKYGNMNEADFIKLADVLDPSLCIPCHFGMFTDHGGDLNKFYEEIKKTKHQFLIMAQCEEYALKEKEYE